MFSGRFKSLFRVLFAVLCSATLALGAPDASRNMPGAVPRTSTIALTNATLKYGLQIAQSGLEEATKASPVIKSGVNCYLGHLTNQNVAKAHNYDYTDLDTLI